MDTGLGNLLCGRTPPAAASQASMTALHPCPRMRQSSTLPTPQVSSQSSPCQCLPYLRQSVLHCEWRDQAHALSLTPACYTPPGARLALAQ